MAMAPSVVADIQAVVEACCTLLDKWYLLGVTKYLTSATVLLFLAPAAQWVLVRMYQILIYAPGFLKRRREFRWRLAAISSNMDDYIGLLTINVSHVLPLFEEAFGYCSCWDCRVTHRLFIMSGYECLAAFVTLFLVALAFIGFIWHQPGTAAALFSPFAASAAYLSLHAAIAWHQKFMIAAKLAAACGAIRAFPPFVTDLRRRRELYKDRADVWLLVNRAGGLPSKPEWGDFIAAVLSGGGCSCADCTCMYHLLWSRPNAEFQPSVSQILALSGATAAGVSYVALRALQAVQPATADMLSEMLSGWGHRVAAMTAWRVLSCLLILALLVAAALLVVWQRRLAAWRPDFETLVSELERIVADSMLRLNVPYTHQAARKMAEQFAHTRCAPRPLYSMVCRDMWRHAAPAVLGALWLSLAVHSIDHTWGLPSVDITAHPAYLPVGFAAGSAAVAAASVERPRPDHDGLGSDGHGESMCSAASQSAEAATSGTWDAFDPTAASTPLKAALKAQSRATARGSCGSSAPASGATAQPQGCCGLQHKAVALGEEGLRAVKQQATVQCAAATLPVDIVSLQPGILSSTTEERGPNLLIALARLAWTLTSLAIAIALWPIRLAAAPFLASPAEAAIAVIFVLGGVSVWYRERLTQDWPLVAAVARSLLGSGSRRGTKGAFGRPAAPSKATGKCGIGSKGVAGTPAPVAQVAHTPALAKVIGKNAGKGGKAAAKAALQTAPVPGRTAVPPPVVPCVPTGQASPFAPADDCVSPPQPRAGDGLVHMTGAATLTQPGTSPQRPTKAKGKGARAGPKVAPPQAGQDLASGAAMLAKPQPQPGLPAVGLTPAASTSLPGNRPSYAVAAAAVPAAPVEGGPCAQGIGRGTAPMDNAPLRSGTSVAHNGPTAAAPALPPGTPPGEPPALSRTSRPVPAQLPIPAGSQPANGLSAAAQQANPLLTPVLSHLIKQHGRATGPSQPFLGLFSKPGTAPAARPLPATASAAPHTAHLPSGTPAASPQCPPSSQRPSSLTGASATQLQEAIASQLRGLSPSGQQQAPPTAAASMAATAAAAAAAANMAQGSHWRTGPREGANPASQCCMCHSGLSSVGFLHGTGVHKCVCKACSSLVALGDPCPVAGCGKCIDRVLDVF